MKKYTPEETKLLKGKRHILLSEIYGHILDKKTSNEEVGLILTLLKQLAINPNLHNPIIIRSDSAYIDLEIKEPRENF